MRYFYFSKQWMSDFIARVLETVNDFSVKETSLLEK